LTPARAVPTLRFNHKQGEPMSRPVVIVTGGSRGIGAATAILAAERGHDVAVNYARDVEAAARVVAACRDAGAKAIAIQGDMAVEADIIRLFDETEAALGPIRHVVNNAGITGQNSKLADADLAIIRATIDVNVTGAILVAREAARRMSLSRGGQGGSIVNLSSVAATLGAPNVYVWYAASKGAIDTLTVGLSQELAREGIRVNGVAPGIIDTEIHASSGMPNRIAEVSASLPLKRPGTALEVAQAILFLMSDESSYTSGTTLRVAGAR
jgi:NAD(P)-dependent dehydrogenase (short-subunit alcohol dehydrogenase family)